MLTRMRMMRRLPLLLPVVAVLALSACKSKSDAEAPPPAAAAPPAAVAKVDAARLTAADSEPGSWMSYGRNYAEQRYSPLGAINKDNVSKLGLAWTYKLDFDRAAEATPVVVDGVMYVTGAFSIVSALDPVTRSELQEWLRRQVDARGWTAVMVTHDIDEALALADDIVLVATSGQIARRWTNQARLRVDPARPSPRQIQLRAEIQAAYHHIGAEELDHA